MYIYLVNVQTTRKIFFSNYVCFSESPNFTFQLKYIENWIILTLQLLQVWPLLPYYCHRHLPLHSLCFSSSSFSFWEFHLHPHRLQPKMWKESWNQSRKIVTEINWQTIVKFSLRLGKKQIFIFRQWIKSWKISRMCPRSNERKKKNWKKEIKKKLKIEKGNKSPNRKGI